MEETGTPAPSGQDSPLADRTLRLGTRSSDLALWQANWVSRRLSEIGVNVEIVHISTQGDVNVQPLGAIGGMGLFTKEIQRALLDEEVDLAVHSLKDLPTEPVDGLTLAAVPERAPIGDALVTSIADGVDRLPQGARIGTGSVRRQAQLLYWRPDLEVLEIRGNVDTRLRKLDEGQYDAIILAEAGLRRLGLEDRIRQVIPLSVMLPAVGQGALGIECRSTDTETVKILSRLNHAEVFAAVSAERALLSSLRAGCLAPVATHGRVENGRVLLDAAVLAPDGSRRIQASDDEVADEAARLGEKLAERLLADGAAALIQAAHKSR